MVSLVHPGESIAAGQTLDVFQVPIDKWLVLSRIDVFPGNEILEGVGSTNTLLRTESFRSDDPAIGLTFQPGSAVRLRHVQSTSAGVAVKLAVGYLAVESDRIGCWPPAPNHIVDLRYDSGQVYYHPGEHVDVFRAPNNAYLVCSEIHPVGINQYVYQAVAGTEELKVFTNALELDDVRTSPTGIAFSPRSFIRVKNGGPGDGPIVVNILGHW